MRTLNVMQRPLNNILLLPVLLLLIPLMAFVVIPQSGENLQQNKEPAVTVGMTNTMKFTPDTVRIEPGETVRWENSSLLAHSVTGDPSLSTIEGSAKLPEGAKPFDSGMMDPKQTFEHTFQVPGTYQYFCIPHEGTKMYGWVIVK